jgi:UDP-glucose 4-epimerase
LLPMLAADGHEVTCVVRNPAGLRAPAGAEWVQADLGRPLEPAWLPEVDAVIHLAQANARFPDGAGELFGVNTASTLELLEHARRCGAGRFVYASSGSVYGLGERPFREDDSLGGQDFYATTKVGAEALVRTYREFMATVVLRLVAPYGPGQRGRMIPGLVSRVAEGRPVTLNDGGRPRMNPLFVEDVCRSVLGLLELDGHHVLNVGGDEPASVKELAGLIGRLLGKEPMFEPGDVTIPGDLVVDTSRLHELLELRPLVSLEEGLRRTIDASVVAATAG